MNRDDKNLIREFLDKKYFEYANSGFIDTDPIQIPHLFSKKEDIEIAGFLTATIAWGQRKSIIKSARQLMALMDNSPYHFISDFQNNDLKIFDDFVYRTFNATDCKFFMQSLRNIYLKHGGLEKVFSGKTIKEAIRNFQDQFFSIPHPERTLKHVSNPAKGSAAKRINMFLRWMIRDDQIDFGIWNNFQTKDLMCPLDIHSGKTARKLSLLFRKQNDWTAVEELTGQLSFFDQEDPVRYDIALFGLGINNDF